MEIISIDASEVADLAIDLGGADERMPPEMRKIVKRGALEIKKGMQKDFTGHRYAPEVRLSLEFSQAGSNAFIAQARIGELDSAGPQWGLAAILAYGTSNNAPVVDHRAALWREVPVVMERLAAAGEDAVLGGPE